MTRRPDRMRARVRHEPDRSYTVIVEGPDGDVEVGNTALLGQVITVATAGAACLFDVPISAVRCEDLRVPRPPYGVDGQLVRMVAAAEEPELRGLLGTAHWFGGEGSWYVTVVGNIAGFIPGEQLDFEPVTDDVERAELQAYLVEEAD